MWGPPWRPSWETRARGWGIRGGGAGEEEALEGGNPCRLRWGNGTDGFGCETRDGA